VTERKVTAVVVTYRSERTIGRTLDSLRRSWERGFLDCVVVDNVSRDRTLEIVRRDHPWARVVETGANVGYGRGCNAGLAVVATPYVLFMNADACIEPEAVETLVGLLESRPEAGMVAPAIVEAGNHQAAGVLTSPWTIVATAAGLPLASLRRREIVPGGPPFRTDWLCGALLATRTALVRDMGGFDDRIFLYFEETDLCRRMLLRGLDLWADGRAVAHHDGGASAVQARRAIHAGCISEHYFRSRYHYLVKHWGRAVAMGTETAEVTLLSLRWAWKRLRAQSAADVVARLRRPIMRLPTMPSRPS
jgi:GT2 family glycosyltransferase